MKLSKGLISIFQSELCVYRPGKGRGWKLELGFTGNCHEQCCEYIPPNEAGQPAGSAQDLNISWYQIQADQECTNNALASKKAQLLTGEVSFF